MEALFAPVPDTRTDYPAPYGAEHHTSVHQAPGQYAPDPYGPGQPQPEQYGPGQGGGRASSGGSAQVDVPRRAHRDGTRRRHHQWGHDRRTRAMPVVARPVSDRRLAIMLTVTAWVGYFVWWLLKDLLNQEYSASVDRAESIMYLAIVTVLTASSLAYLLSRLGYFCRTRSHHRTSRAVLERFYDDSITDAQEAAVIAGGHADVLVSHDCPSGVAHTFGRPPPQWDPADLARSDAHRRRLQRIVDGVQPSRIMHGHLHRAYQRSCDFGYGPVQVTGLDADGRLRNFAVLDIADMRWELREGWFGRLRRNLIH